MELYTCCKPKILWSDVAHLQTSLGSGCRVVLPRLDWHNLDDVQENQFPLKFVEEVEVR